MPPRTRAGSTELGVAIRERRITLGLSIQEAAAKAAVGTKSWGRYEAGAAIRQDKVRSICRALGWVRLPGSEEHVEQPEDRWLREVDSSHQAWSVALEESYGRACAVTFAVGSDILGDHLADDIAGLSRERRGTHLGQLSASWLDAELPPQFLPRYDYEFMYGLKAAVEGLRKRFVEGSVVAHSVLEEVALFLIFGQAELLADIDPEFFETEEDVDWREWLGGILGDLDVEFFLFTSGWALTRRMSYHFDHWDEMQFYTDGEKLTDSERGAAMLGSLYVPTGADSGDTVDEASEPS